MTRLDTSASVKTPTRVILAAVGLVLAGFGGVLIRGVVRELHGGEAWSELAAAAGLSLVLICAGAQSLYIALAGRMRGRINRWLSATWQSITASLP
jgi:hypothetical protein